MVARMAMVILWGLHSWQTVIFAGSAYTHTSLFSMGRTPLRFLVHEIHVDLRF